MKTVYVGLSVLFFLLISCESRQVKKQAEIKTTVKEAETIYASASDQQWNELEAKFDQLESEYKTERDSYSKEQRDSINLQIGKFRAMQSKRTANKIKEDINDFGKQVEGYIDEISK
jgi:hypothetical protein